MINPMIGMPGTWEMVIILAIVILVFGAAKLPELARGTGQALRIFKSETKGLRDDDAEAETPPKASGELPPGQQPGESPTESTREQHPGSGS